MFLLFLVSFFFSSLTSLNWNFALPHLLFFLFISIHILLSSNPMKKITSHHDQLQNLPQNSSLSKINGNNYALLHNQKYILELFLWCYLDNFAETMYWSFKLICWQYVYFILESKITMFNVLNIANLNKSCLSLLHCSCFCMLLFCIKHSQTFPDLASLPSFHVY